ncbi:MAG: 4Fe-4S binding protein [Actinomycetota bacterium]
MGIRTDQEVGPGAAQPNGRRRGLPGIGLIKGLGVTLKHMLQRSITQEYPHEKPDLPPRTRGVIALKQENCTVCWKCSRECPDWCIYIESHKETHPPASGGRARSVKVLDRFAIDYALCMYCGICVEVCPFDALFWSPEFEYAEYDIFQMTHEKDRLEEWTYRVLPPPELEVGAEPPEETEEAPPIETGGGEPVAARPPSADQIAASGAQPPQAGGGPPRGSAEPTSPATGQAPAADAAGTAAPSAPAETAASAVQSGATTAVPAEAPHPERPAADAAAAPGPATPAAPAPGAPAARPTPEHVEPDQETYDRVLAEELAKGTDRRVAEGRAKASAVRVARKKAAGG